MACRDTDKAAAAAAHIRQVPHCSRADVAPNPKPGLRSPHGCPGPGRLQACPSAELDILQLDLADQDSIRRLAAHVKQRGLAISILVNFLGPYTLTRLLEDALVAGAPSRVANCLHKEKEKAQTRQRWDYALQVVNVSSITHRYVDIPDANKFLHDFASGLYAQCKLANVLFTNELHRRWRGRNIEAFAVDPGAVLSDIWRNSKYSRPPWKWLAQSTFSPTWDGAIPVIHAAMGDTSNAASDRKNTAVFFARGAFAWPIFTLPPPGILKYLLPVTGVFYLLDWPLRRLSQGRLLSRVRSVRSSPISYNVKLAQELWEVAADVAGIPRH
eukprot:SM000099S25255  [mRNA]  locus=s99:435087:437403:- [translate_table: standard]